MAISRLRSTMTLITEYEPNMSMAQNRVKEPRPTSSKASNSTSPNEAQNRDCEVSNRLQGVRAERLSSGGVRGIKTQETERLR